MRFEVSYEFREDTGEGAGTPTNEDVVIVDAEDEGAARLAAIDVAYAKYTPCSHVRVRTAAPVDD